MTCREKLVTVAVSQLGVKEPNGDDTYIKWYNKKSGTKFGMGVAWCCIFVSWVFDYCKLGKYCKPNASCTQLFSWYKANGRAYKRGEYVPQSGDVVFYDWNPGANDGPDHVGIVEKVLGNMICTVEGNYNDSVKRRWVDYRSSIVYGFASPDFPTGDVNGDGKVNATDAKEILKTVVKKSSKATVKNADVDGDGKVTANDAKEVLKKAVKK